MDEILLRPVDSRALPFAVACGPVGDWVFTSNISAMSMAINAPNGATEMRKKHG